MQKEKQYPTTIEDFIDYMVSKYPNYFMKSQSKLMSVMGHIIIIASDGDINFEGWHNKKFTDKYSFCQFKNWNSDNIADRYDFSKFNITHTTTILEDKDYKFFEQLAVSYFEYIDAYQPPEQ